MRGKVRRLWMADWQGGIIPAGAGKSATAWTSAWVSEDHPRGCGEKSQRNARPSAPKGSSPRVRGKGAKRSDRLVGCGIIPAGAGKSTTMQVVQANRGDHPRGCGEKTTVPTSETTGPGSSPRVRGKESIYYRHLAAHRIIPAGAGKSSGEVPCGCVIVHHPRGCGEKLPKL